MALTLSELARQVDGDIVRGEPSFLIEGIAALDEAGPSELSFLGNERYRQQFLETRAGAVFVPPGVTAGPESAALIAVENPSLAFGVAVKHFTAAHARVFEPGIDPRAIIDESVGFDPAKVRIHAGAVVMAGAVIGDGTEIGPNVVVGEKVVIGSDCLLHALVSIRERCVLGDRVIVQPGAVIGSDGFGYETVEGRHVKMDQIGIVVLEDDVEIGANTTIDRARFGRTVIGAGSKIDNLVQIAHNVQIGEHNLLVSQTGVAGSSKTGKYVVMAAQAGVAGHVKIGDQAVFAARTGATADLEGGKTYGGYPAQPHMDDQRQKAALRKLPDLIKRVKRLEE
ncbi:UDP-3-O-(3-hydroxymyristoyl)glucosamine N-acyltransferase [Haloferula sp. A504]|uniref:UDP-3-O-(3-hydroxymyristoyl)glucosamine N-acyltransferase n=1 Tax=Haloferula sp. A504 TaxID=3373601 RepID=UPI0031C41FD3|nr:UDP-3-O-(3-hydroxymyristoyl)glucosamine N-acyltransferase [Verrucomicrobiaceae bacterium E54]